MDVEGFTGNPAGLVAMVSLWVVDVQELGWEALTSKVSEVEKKINTELPLEKLVVFEDIASTFSSSTQRICTYGHESGRARQTPYGPSRIDFVVLKLKTSSRSTIEGCG